MNKVMIWAGVFIIAEMFFGWLIDWWLVGGIVLAAKMFIDAFRMEREGNEEIDCGERTTNKNK